MGRQRSKDSEENLLRPLLLRVGLLSIAVATLLVAFASTSPAPGDLLLPVRYASPADLSDTFLDPREGGRRHQAIDISAPWGTPVLATDDGIVDRLSTSELGGIGLYLLDRDHDRCYYYGHLASYSRGLREGGRVARGEVVGYVGSTGNASENAPHLHFAVYDVSGDRTCSSGAPLDPFPLLAPRPIAAD